MPKQVFKKEQISISNCFKVHNLNKQNPPKSNKCQMLNKCHELIKYIDKAKRHMTRRKYRRARLKEILIKQAENLEQLIK